MNYIDPWGLRPTIGAYKPDAVGYTLVVYVDQPGSGGTRATYELHGRSAETGHVTATLIDNDSGASTSVGFYPNYQTNGNRPKDVLFGQTVPGKIVDDSNYDRKKIDVKSSFQISNEQGENIKQFIDNTKKNTPGYNLSTYNCTNYVVNLCETGGITLPKTSGSWPGGSGLNPGDMGEDLRLYNKNKNNKNGRTSKCKG